MDPYATQALVFAKNPGMAYKAQAWGTSHATDSSSTSSSRSSTSSQKSKLSPAPYNDHTNEKSLLLQSQQK